VKKVKELMEYETAGDPVSDLKWTRKTRAKITVELRSLGIDVSRGTVGRLLKKMKFRLRVNHKKIESGIKKQTKQDKKNRDSQFHLIKKVRINFTKKGNPIISVDTKGRELIGNFKNQGAALRKKAVATNDHDFPSDADGVGIPYGIYDVTANVGMVNLGISHDTPEFAVASIEKWWRTNGKNRYGKKKALLILADSGGSNGSSSRVWKRDIQNRLCDRYGLAVTVCHHPPGSSKWNPIEHRYFSQISNNWRGIPLKSYETMIKYIQTTRTSTGLKSSAFLDCNSYEKGIEVNEEEMEELAIVKHEPFTKWNYTLLPRKM